MNAEHRREIEEALRAVLAQQQIDATIDVREGFVEATAGGRTIAVQTGPLGIDWPNLSPQQRRDAIGRLAQRLVDTARAPTPSRAAPGRRSAIPWTAIAVVLFVGFVGVVAMFGVIQKWFKGSDAAAPSAEGASSAAPRESDEAASARRARVCEATRKRVYAGASVGPLEVDGWVAELWLAKRGGDSLANAPALKAFLAGDKIAPSADAEIAKVQGGKVGFVDATAPELGKAWHEAVVRFSGRYMDGYLDPAGRARFEALASRVYAASGADMGALYGRCAHLSTHELGAWFAGPDAASTSAALLASIGLASDVSAVDKKKLGLEGLDVLQKAGRDLDATELAASVGASGGNVSAADGPVVLTFAVGGPIRAGAASRALARRLKVDSSYSPAE